MNQRKALKKQLCDSYCYEKIRSASDVRRILSTAEPLGFDMVVSSLTVGCVRLEAVLYQQSGRKKLGYDLVRAFYLQKRNVSVQSFKAEFGAVWQSFGKGCFFRKFGFSGRMQIIIASRKKGVLLRGSSHPVNTDRQRRSEL